MSTYKEIRGRLIKTVTSDPTYATAGEMWYNKTIGALKARTFVAATWTSGGALPNPRFDVTGAKQQVRSAALAIGGYSPATPGVGSPNTFEYNGSSWSGGGNLNTGRVNVAGGGTQTAAIFIGGAQKPAPGSSTVRINNTVEYDGTNWTAGGNYPTNVSKLGTGGTQTDLLGFAGIEQPTGSPPSTYAKVTKSYDGSSWTSLSATLTTNGSQGDGSGSTTSGDSLIYGGYDGSATQKTTEEWDAGGTFNKIVTTS